MMKCLTLFTIFAYVALRTDAYLHYLVGMEQTMLYSVTEYLHTCPKDGEVMKQQLKTYEECMGEVNENIDTLGQAVSPEYFKKVAKNLKRVLSPESINRISNNAAATYCKSTKPPLDCFLAMVPMLKSCNHTRATDAIRLFTAINQIRRTLCSGEATKYADYYREQLSQDCFDVSTNPCSERLGPMWMGYLQGKKNESSSLFKPENCKLLKEAGDCVVEGLNSCPLKKSVPVFKSVHRTLLVNACGSDYY